MDEYLQTETTAKHVTQRAFHIYEVVFLVVQGKILTCQIICANAVQNTKFKFSFCYWYHNVSFQVTSDHHRLLWTLKQTDRVYII